MALAVVVLASAGCRLNRRDDTSAPDTAGTGGASASGAPTAPFDPYAGTEAAEAASGEVVARTIATADGRKRTYRLYVPASLKGGGPAPLVVALHGGTGSGEQFERSAGYDGLAEANRFLVAYPDGVGRGPGDNLRTWNAGGCCPVASTLKVDDVGFLRRLITEVTSLRPVDPKRIFAVGHSNGAMLAYRTACELGDRVAAVALQSGTLEIDGCKPSAAVSLFHVHGTDDQNVPIDGGNGSRTVSGVEYRPPRESAAIVARADGCTGGPADAVDTGNADLTVSTWQGCPAGVDVRFVAVAGASHAWMGHDRGPVVNGLVGESYPDLDTTRATWSFLAAHPRP